MQEDRCRTLESDQERRIQAMTKLENNLTNLQALVKGLQADKADLLQLINILSSAPIAAKSVLESYLAKLAGNAPRGSVLRDKVMDAKSLPMGDRIDQLLLWKRNKDKKIEDENRNDGKV